MKLDDLCAIKVMGWHHEGISWYDSEGKHMRFAELTPPATIWNPSTSLDDALVCLERAFWKDRKKQFWFFKYWKGGYSCGPLSSEWAVTAVEPQIAMCLAALRAMGVPESEISLAME